ncbi:MAG: hypothetical protein R2845_15060 [Thermomicrobiales bacterium]
MPNNSGMRSTRSFRELRVETAVKLLRELSTALERVTAAEQIAGSERILAAQIERPDAQLETRPLYARYEALLAWMQTSPPPMAPPVPRSIRIVALIAALFIVAEAGLLGYYWNEYAYGIAANWPRDHRTHLANPRPGT